MVKYIIDSEVSEEIQEIINSGFIENNDTVIICCPTHVFQSEFKKFSVYTYTTCRYRLLNKIKQFSYLFYLMVKFRPDVIFSGYPLLKHRITSLLSLGRVKHYSYLRGLFADPKNYKGFSDFLYLKLLNYPKLLKICNFQCDRIFTVSKINVDFLIARGVLPLLITLIPPPWLKLIKKRREDNLDCAGGKGYIYFVTQAFSSHSFKDAAASQIKFALKIKGYLDADCIDLIIRKHPRDYTNYEGLGFFVNKVSSYDFISSLNVNDILISPFSTLAAEASYFGIRVIFYSSLELDNIYSKIYERLGIKPFYKAEDVCNEITLFQSDNNYGPDLKEIFFND
ncbi:hypothetical protein PF050_08665 [Kosakonia pseudosacchari]|uniref:hypothetical protein n=1 Tax=Kosakonia pseudosacchari TaxID=1646340 RepID=UPI0022F04817|nr:hypothetical protein [Kosakonia pseudosacchari]WBU50969.1 hypothetical protein PF050_08665 [Kosakonia pseudosacchari]